jgi:hypothetical protein
VALPAAAAQQTATWLGGSGLWTEGDKWSTGAAPKNSGGDTFAVVIDNGNAAASVVTLNTNPTVDSLVLDAGDTLTIVNANGLTLATEDGLVNNGTLTLDGNDSNFALTGLTLSAGGTIAGSGHIALSNDSENRVVTGADKVITLGSAQTLSGAGRLLDGSGGLVNQGTIQATLPKGLVIDPGSPGFENQGTLRATGGGTLELRHGTFTNTGQAISAEADSTVRLEPGTEVVGGTLKSVGDGLIAVDGNTTLDGVAVEGRLDQGDGARVTVVGDLTNDALWKVIGTGNFAVTEVYFETEGASLSGSGTLEFNDDAQNTLSALGALTQDGGHTIRGRATIDAPGGLTNLGTIEATLAGRLILKPGSPGFVNQGTVAATGSGGLENLGIYRQTAGTTRVETLLESTGDLDLEGGLLTGSGEVKARLDQTGGTVSPGSSPGTLTVTGDYDQDPGGTLLVEIGASAHDLLKVTGNASLAGTLEVNLLDGFEPALGRSFDVLEATSIVYDPSAEDFPVFAAGTFAASVVPISEGELLRLTAVVPLPPSAWLLLCSVGLVLLLQGRRHRG